MVEETPKNVSQGKAAVLGLQHFISNVFRSSCGSIIDRNGFKIQQ